MEELYNWKQVKAYAIIGLNNLLKSANKDNVNNLKQFDMFLDALPKVYKKNDVIKYANFLKEQN